MEINPSKFAGFVVGVASLLLVLGSSYFLFTIFFGGPEPQVAPDVKTINVSLFGPKIQKAASTLVNDTDKVSLKTTDLEFSKSKLFNSFTDLPEAVPPSDSRGRPDPFVPYVAP